MSNFLGASVQNAGLVVLAENVTLSVSTTSAQVLYTVVQQCMPFAIVLKKPNVALSATTTFKLGVTGNLISFIPTTLASSLPTTGGQLTLCSNFITNGLATTALAVQTSSGPVAAAGVVYFAAVTVDPTAVTVQADLLGYLL